MYNGNRFLTTTKSFSAAETSTPPDSSRQADSRRAQRRPEFVEGIDERFGLRPVDADDPVEPRRQGDGLDEQRDQTALAIAHVEHLADDRFLLTVVAQKVARRDHGHGEAALANAALHFQQKAGIGGEVALVDRHPIAV